MVEYLDGGRIQGLSTENGAEGVYATWGTTPIHWDNSNLSHAAYGWSAGRKVQSAEAGNNTTKISFYLKTVSSSSPYNTRVVIYNSSGSVRATSSTVAASTIGTTGEWVEYSGFSLTLNTGDYTMMEVFGSTSTNGVETGRRNDAEGDYGYYSQNGYTNFVTYGTDTDNLYKYTGATAEITNVPDGTRFEETDTRKIYRYDSAVTLQEGGWSGTLDDAISLYSYQGGGVSGVFVQINSGSALVGMNVSRVGLQIIKHSNVGSISYPACVGVWDSSNFPTHTTSDRGAKHVFAEFNLRDLSQAYTDEPSFGVDGDHDTGCDGEYTLQAGDYLGVSAHQGSGATVLAQVKASYDGDKFDGTNTQIAFHQGAQTSFTNMADNGEDDMYIKIYGKAGWVERGTAV